MARKSNIFWVAPGVVHIEGKEYGHADPLPVTKIDKNLLAKWFKTGKVIEKTPVKKKEDKPK